MAAPAASDGSSGQIGTALAKNLYCNTETLLQGNIGLMIGLILVFMGIWAMVQGAKMMAAIPMIIMGALITALPSIVEASLEGLSNLLKASGISSSDTKVGSFTPPDCSGSAGTAADGSSLPTVNEMQRLYTNPQTGLYYPGHVSTDVAPSGCVTDGAKGEETVVCN